MKGLQEMQRTGGPINLLDHVLAGYSMVGGFTKHSAANSAKLGTGSISRRVSPVKISEGF
jgi:hypothetical protein